MSQVLIRAALEQALAEISPQITTAWEDSEFDAEAAPAAEPYQRVEMLWAQPSNNENTASWTELGILQVTLCYPAPGDGVPIGPAAIEARVGAIRAKFHRKASFAAGGVTVTIDRTPHTMPKYRDGGRRCVPVRIPFYAHISA